ncbi:Protein of unknown function [Micromonospora pattaloongensis]|uniref:DUF559 domain-containing protein n=2 Tax=Micromonospora pattaloongensis TaxID=405436 RepID=A0A1H3M355_9ACTN|nr:Protein of unknown function [Micromonospora pattaloongensis]
MRYRELRACGLPRGQLRGHLDRKRLLRPFHDVYVDRANDEATRLRALLRRLPAEAIVCRHTAAALHGFGDFAPRPTAVHILLPAGLARPELRGVTVHETALPAEPVLVNGVRCTSIARSAVDLARTCRRLDALPVLDGLPRPRTQVRVLDDFDRLRYVIDLGWEEQQVGAEYDGLSHLDRDRARHDRARHNWLSAQGWRMRYFTDWDLYRRPHHIAAVLRTTLSPT